MVVMRRVEGYRVVYSCIRVPIHVNRRMKEPLSTGNEIVCVAFRMLQLEFILHSATAILSRPCNLSLLYYPHRSISDLARCTRAPTMPSSQTKISQHFSPRAPRAGPSSATGPTRRAASIKSRDDTSDNSEGSEGLNAIHLASDRRPCNPEALPMSQKRARRKAVLDSEDEDDGIAQDASRRQKLGAALSRSRSPTRPEITLEENRGDSDPAALYAADKTSPTLRRSGRTRRPPTEPSVRPPRKARPPPLSGILASGTRTIRTQSSAPTSRSSFHIEVPTLSEEVKSSYRCFPSPPCNASAKPTTAVRPSDPEQRRPHRAPSAKSDSDDQPILIVSSSESEKPRSHQKGDPNARSAEAKEKRSVQKSGRKRVTAKVRSGGQSRTKRHDPDEEEDAATEEEVDIAGELAMDEPERFKSDSRLRKRRETSVQRRIRKLKNQRLGIVESWSSESESSSEATYTSDSAPDTDEEENWIVEDGGVVGEGLLPHEFSFNSIQTPEFKFKVVFHYFLLLVIKGPGILPLKGDTAEYLLPQLRDLRRRLEGFKNSRVRSQIWRTDFVRALEAFPVFEVGPGALSLLTV